MALVHTRNPNRPATVTQTMCVQLAYSVPTSEDGDEEDGYSKYQEDCVDDVMLERGE
jgi:hypothetical protein